MSTEIVNNGSAVAETPRSMDEAHRDRIQSQLHIMAEMQVAHYAAEAAYLDLEAKIHTLSASMRVFAQGFDTLTSFVKEGK